jgi:hypothetical protein
MIEVEEGKKYFHRTEKVTYFFSSKTEFIYLGQFVKIISFNDADETANIMTRLGEYSTVQMDELKPKPTVFYDDIPVAESHTPIEDDNKPKVGDVVDGGKVLRSKPVLISTIVGYNRCETLDDSIRFSQHPRRPMVFWCTEIG